MISAIAGPGRSCTRRRSSLMTSGREQRHEAPATSESAPTSSSGDRPSRARGRARRCAAARPGRAASARSVISRTTRSSRRGAPRRWRSRSSSGALSSTSGSTLTKSGQRRQQPRVDAPRGRRRRGRAVELGEPPGARGRRRRARSGRSQRALAARGRAPRRRRPGRCRGRRSAGRRCAMRAGRQGRRPAALVSWKTCTVASPSARDRAEWPAQRSGPLRKGEEGSGRGSVIRTTAATAVPSPATCALASRSRSSTWARTTVLTG